MRTVSPVSAVSAVSAIFAISAISTVPAVSAVLVLLPGAVPVGKGRTGCADRRASHAGPQLIEFVERTDANDDRGGVYGVPNRHK
jgi:hypothetical protein